MLASVEVAFIADRAAAKASFPFAHKIDHAIRMVREIIRGHGFKRPQILVFTGIIGKLIKGINFGLVTTGGIIFEPINTLRYHLSRRGLKFFVHPNGIRKIIFPYFDHVAFDRCSHCVNPCLFGVIKIPGEPLG